MIKMSKEKTVANIVIAKQLFLKKIDDIMDLFNYFVIQKNIVKDNPYSKLPWVDFELKVYPGIIYDTDLVELVNLKKEMTIDFNEECIKIRERYFLKDCSSGQYVKKKESQNPE